MEPGTRIGSRYEIRSVGGRSWLGQRYRARDLEVDIEVALLSVNLQLLPDGNVKRALPHFLRLKSLQSPQIVRMYDAFSDDAAGALYVVEPWLEAIELRKYLAGMHKRREVMTEEELVDFVKQLVNGLDYAHRSGLLVPELSSETVFVDGSGLRIAGVGYAQAVGQERLRQQLVETAGERALPPELMFGQPATIRTDVFRLTQLVVEMARRTPLQKGEPPLVQALDEAHRGIALGIDRGLATQEEQRPESPMALCRALWPRKFMAPDLTELDATAPVLRVDPDDSIGSESPGDVPTREIDARELRKIQGRDVTRRVSDEELFPHRVLAAQPESALFDERAANLALQSQSPIGLYEATKETTSVGKKPLSPNAPLLVDEDGSKEIEILELPSEALVTEEVRNLVPPPSAPSAPPAPKTEPPKRLTAVTMLAQSQATPVVSSQARPLSQQFGEEDSKIIEIRKPQPHHAAAQKNPQAAEGFGSDDDPSKIIEIVRVPVSPSPSPSASIDLDLHDDAMTTPRPLVSAEDLTDEVLVTDRQHIVPTPHELREASGPFAIPSPAVLPEPLPPPPPPAAIPSQKPRSRMGAIAGGAMLTLALAAVGYAAWPHVMGPSNPNPTPNQTPNQTPNPTPIPTATPTAKGSDLSNTPSQPIVTKPDVPVLATPPSPTPSGPSGPSATPGAAGACPDGMKPVATKPKVCIDQYEFPGKAQSPKTAVTLMEAGQLCAHRGARLCLDAEWEAACRGPKASSYPYGGGHDAKKCNEDKSRGLVATGTFAECVSASDAYDMSGNAAEWVQSGNVRGGAAGWGNPRCSQLGHEKPEAQNPLIGFRCCSDQP